LTRVTSDRTIAGVRALRRSPSQPRSFRCRLRRESHPEHGRPAPGQLPSGPPFDESARVEATRRAAGGGFTLGVVGVTGERFRQAPWIELKQVEHYQMSVDAKKRGIRP